MSLLNLIRQGGDAIRIAQEVGLRSGVFILLVLVAGSVALIAPVVVATAIGLGLSWALEAAGFGDPRSLWGLSVIPIVGFLIGMALAADVMYRATRSGSTIGDITGLDDGAETFEPAPDSDEDAPPEIDLDWLRDVDARHAAPTSKPRPKRRSR